MVVPPRMDKQNTKYLCSKQVLSRRTGGSMHTCLLSIAVGHRAVRTRERPVLSNRLLANLALDCVRALMQ